MQLLLRNYMNKDFDKDAFAASCKLHLQLSVRCTTDKWLCRWPTPQSSMSQKYFVVIFVVKFYFIDKFGLWGYLSSSCIFLHLASNLSALQCCFSNLNINLIMRLLTSHSEDTVHFNLQTQLLLNQPMAEQGWYFWI